MFARFTFCFGRSTDFLACVLDIEFVDDVQKRSEIVVLLIIAVNAVVDCNEADIAVRKFDFRIHSDFKIISAYTGHILDDNSIDFPCIDKRNQLLPSRSVEIRSRIAVIGEVTKIFETVFVCVLFEHRLLRCDLSRVFSLNEQDDGTFHLSEDKKQSVHNMVFQLSDIQ